MLYKYFPPQRTEVLLNQTVRFTPFNVLNDPFECLFNLNPLPREEFVADEDDYFSEFNVVKGYLNNHIGQLGMFCLSRSRDSILMWSHYAQDHKGFVVGFDEQHAFFNTTGVGYMPSMGDFQPLRGKGFGSLRQVDYQPNKISISEGDNIPFESLFRKASEWHYENEYRMFRNLKDASIINKEQTIHLFELPDGVIQEVILGAESSGELPDIIHDAMTSGKLANIKLRQASYKGREYGLKFETKDLLY